MIEHVGRTYLWSGICVGCRANYMRQGLPTQMVAATYMTAAKVRRQCINKA